MSTDYTKNFESATPAPPPEADIAVLGFSSRTYNCLRRSRRTTVGGLLNTTWRELRRIRNLGKVTEEEILATLSKYGLTLKSEE